METASTTPEGPAEEHGGKGEAERRSPSSVAAPEAEVDGVKITAAMEALQAELEAQYEAAAAGGEGDEAATGEGVAAAVPRLLQAAAAEVEASGALDAAQQKTVAELLGQAESQGQASFQLETLLQKAAQYSNFITSNIAATEAAPAPTDAKKRKRKGGKGSSPKTKRARAARGGSADKRGEIGEKGASMAAGRSGNASIEQPANMVNGTLKDYQLEGLRWLVTLWQNGMSGILADEMGLGKTIQIIALLAHMREKHVKGNFLITAPLATLPNWISEIRKWVPDVPVVLYHGTRDERAALRRSRMAPAKVGSGDFPVVVTSFEMATIDRTHLEKYPWKYLIVDEGQRIKNMNCRLVRELKRLRTENRILLSGTPIQNSLEELWSLLNFVNPEIFDDLGVFRSWFGFRNIGRKSKNGAEATSVEAILDEEENSRIVTKLHEILRPFLLRRLKRDVLQDLVPPKREVVVYCGMSSLQQEYYALAKQRKLRQALLDMGFSENQDMKEGTHLMVLRRICLHPFLFGEPRDPATQEYIGVQQPQLFLNASGKLRTLDRLLQRLHGQRALDGSRQRVLIFSQFTSMLNVLEDYLAYREWGYCRIDGTSKIQDRADAIDAFNAPDSDRFAFLLSTRAGGLGINLATANTVVLFDSDWNPTMDAQAQDRAHRIGQKNPVTVYRLLTVGSVEIDMMEQAVAKKKLERMAIGGGDYRRAGQRSRGTLTLDALKRLLEDDVRSLEKRNAGDMSVEVQDEISDAELEAVMDPQRLFAGEPWAGLRPSDPLERNGEMYDIVELDASDILDAMK